MKQEFDRLISLGWQLPPQNDEGLYFYEVVDENLISFPSSSYDAEAVNGEASGFWAIERANAIARILKPFNVKILWEIGAGNGNVAIPLNNMGIQVIPVEPLHSGATTLAKNGFPTFLATLESLNLPENSLDAVGAFDVLEHLESPEELVKEINRVLKVGGIFICSVPAYQWLFSDFDVSIGHFRRYSSESLGTLLRLNGFNHVRFSYLFGFLVPAAFVLRRLPFIMGRRRLSTQISSSSTRSSKLLTKIERLLRLINKLEQKTRLKLGLSILALSTK